MMRWQTGNIDAFEALFRQYERLVFHNAYLITGSKEEAKDILQEVFVAVWKFRQTYNPEKGKLTTWLSKITVNECMKSHRKKWAAEIPLENADPAGVQAEYDEVLVTRQEYENLIQCLNSLDRKHRAVLVLRFFNELSYEEIAQTIGIPLGTVKSRIFVALKMLREKLADSEWDLSYLRR